MRHAGRRWAKLALLADQRGQRGSFNILHRVEMTAPFASDCEDRHDMRMVELGDRLSLDAEPLQFDRVERRGVGEDLERNAPAEGDLLGLVDDGHPAAGDLAKKAILAQHRIGRQRIFRRPGRAIRVARLGRGVDEFDDVEPIGERSGDLRMLLEPASRAKGFCPPRAPPDRRPGPRRRAGRPGRPARRWQRRAPSLPGGDCSSSLQVSQHAAEMAQGAKPHVLDTVFGAIQLPAPRQRSSNPRGASGR